MKGRQKAAKTDRGGHASEVAESSEATEATEAAQERSSVMVEDRDDERDGIEDADGAQERDDDDERVEDDEQVDTDDRDEDDEVEDDDDRVDTDDHVDTDDRVEDDEQADAVEYVDDVDDVDDADDADLDDEQPARSGPGRVTFLATLGVAVVAVLAALFLLGAYVWPAFLGPGAPDDTANRAVAALGTKDSPQLQQLGCVRADGTPSFGFQPELLGLIGGTKASGPIQQTLESEARQPIDLTFAQGGQSQTVPAALIFAVNDGQWCLNGIAQQG